MKSSTTRMGRSQLTETLRAIGARLARPASLCLFGSAPLILAGAPFRKTEDVDVLRHHSKFDLRDLATAVRSSGLEFNPTWETETPYLHLIDRDNPMVILPEFPRPPVIETFGNLALTCPPLEILAARKLQRCSAVDLQDIRFIVEDMGITRDAIRRAIRQFPRSEIEIRENAVMLDFLPEREVAADIEQDVPATDPAALQIHNA